MGGATKKRARSTYRGRLSSSPCVPSGTCFLERSALQHAISSCNVQGDDARASQLLKPGKHVRTAERSADVTLPLVYNSNPWYKIRRLLPGVKRLVAAEMNWDNI